ncbi:MAG: transcriptional regulator [Verrucomicrobia bacterium]|jgi:DNA-binding HxlR family transcriptional regulator|nr:transcriptional regulator [Verrucomicrobiota bacterium]
MKPRRTQKKTDQASQRRSPCPIACGLDLFGDKWTMLVIRDLALGKTSFKDFATGPEHIPTNILSDRLTRLLDHDMIGQAPVEGDGRRLAYHLTPKGAALRPVLLALRDWGLEWIEGTAAKRA